MAKLWITEYRGVGRQAGAEAAQVPALPELTVQTVTFTTSTASGPCRDDTTLIRVYADEACHLAFGSAPVATTDSTPLPAATEFFVQIQPGGDTRVAAITA